MGNWALVRNNVVENIIVVDNDVLPDGVEPFDPEAYVAADDNDWQRAVDCSTLAREPAIGWIFKRGIGYVPPEEITVDRESIPPDGKTSATVTYTDHRPSPPAQLDAVVNGESRPLPLTDGVGVLHIASSTPGDAVLIFAGGVSVVVPVDD